MAEARDYTSSLILSAYIEFLSPLVHFLLPLFPFCSLETLCVIRVHRSFWEMALSFGLACTVMQVTAVSMLAVSSFCVLTSFLLLYEKISSL